MKKRKKLFFATVASVIALSSGCTVKEPSEYETVKVTEMEYGEKPVTNPMKGFTAWGENYTDDPWVSFAYAAVYWDQIEPEEGQYDFETLENQWNFKKWNDRGVHMILRVVTDTPSDEQHMNIPQWLYERTGGTWYDNDYGKGLAPSYDNEEFQKAHSNLIKALSERYGNDSSVAFIQLGSLGHWGEWHQNTDVQFPTQDVTDIYVKHYLDNFPSYKLLMRRPYQIAAENGIGLYNDSFGKESSHNRWLDWIDNGYESDQTGEILAGMPDFWMKGASGGELATSYDDEWFFTDEQFDTTLEYLKESHTTFIGPNRPKYEEFSDNQNVIKFLSEMGYCYCIQTAETGKADDGSLQLVLNMANLGIAPMYGEADISVYYMDDSLNVLWQTTERTMMNEYLPGTFNLTYNLPSLDNYGNAGIYVEFKDAMENGKSIQLANKNDTGFMYRVY